MILRDGKRLIDDRKVSKRCLSSIRIIESETELENKHHCNSSDFFSPSTSPLFYFPRPVPRFIWHAIRVHLVSMKSKSIFSQITHASRLRFCDNTREYHFSPPSFSVFSFILSFILFIYFVSFEISLRNRKFIEGVEVMIRSVEKRKWYKVDNLFFLQNTVSLFEELKKKYMYIFFLDTIVYTQ